MSPPIANAVPTGPEYFATPLARDLVAPELFFFFNFIGRKLSGSSLHSTFQTNSRTDSQWVRSVSGDRQRTQRSKRLMDRHFWRSQSRGKDQNERTSCGSLIHDPNQHRNWHGDQHDHDQPVSSANILTRSTSSES